MATSKRSVITARQVTSLQLESALKEPCGKWGGMRSRAENRVKGCTSRSGLDLSYFCWKEKYSSPFSRLQRLQAPFCVALLLPLQTV